MDLAKALQVLGMGRYEANVLSFLIKKKRAYLVEIEHGTGLRQPEVSLALRTLRDLGVVELRDERKKVKMGRPRKIVTLKSIDGIMKSLQRKKELIDLAYKVVENEMKVI